MMRLRGFHGGSCSEHEEDPIVSQRNMVYIAGAVILVIVIIYFFTR
jgi:hypothetical protein